MKVRVKFGNYRRFLRCKRCPALIAGILVKTHDPCPKCGREGTLVPTVARSAHVVRMGWFGHELWAINGHDYNVATYQELMITVDGKSEYVDSDRVYEGKQIKFAVTWGNTLPPGFND
jgi:hypothetical protein